MSSQPTVYANAYAGPATDAPRVGRVYLVGAGPGDPELITVKGARLLREGDAVVYDRLVHPSLIPGETEAELHYVGKRDGEVGSARQEDINALLVRLAYEGKQVVRLKGGDPFVFGRGGEEALALAEAGVAFEVVPGVTAGVAVPAFAGIPVTQRGVSTSVTFVTANADPSSINAPVNWRAIARLRGTVVIFMGARTFASIAPLLIDGGLDGETPAAAIEWGTCAQQRTVVGTVATLPDMMDDSGLDAPLTIVIGDVVRLHHRIAWFPEARSLVAQTVVPELILQSHTGILLIDHGSRLSEANEMLHEVAALVERSIIGAAIVCPAHMELAEPTIAQGFAACVGRGAREVVAVPYMLSPGRHSTRDIPRLVADAARQFPDINWRVSKPLGVDHRIADLVLNRASA